LLVALAFAAAAPASEQHPTQGELESELVCPSCHVPLDESNSAVAQQMKTFIHQHIALGWTKSRIEGALAAQLGDGIYGVPRTSGFDLIAWVLPFGCIVLGAAAITSYSPEDDHDQGVCKAAFAAIDAIVANGA